MAEDSKVKRFCAYCGEEVVKLEPWRHATELHGTGHYPEPVAEEVAPIAASTPPEEADAIDTSAWTPEQKAAADTSKAAKASGGKGK